MEIILTKHCKQRRKNLLIRDSSEIIKWLEYLVIRFDISNLDKGNYSIKGNQNFLVFNKQNTKLTIITFGGFKNEIWDLRDLLKLKLINLDTKDSLKIWRVNIVGRTVHCGSITYNKDNSVRVKLRKNVFDKYSVNINKPYTRKGFCYSSIKDVDFLNKIKGQYLINFKRKD